MNLHRLLQQRAAAGKPVRVGLIGAGKFGSMFLNQVPMMAGLEVSVIADLDPERARDACRTVGWEAPRIARTRFVASGAEACADPGSRSSSRRPAARPLASPMPAQRSPPANNIVMVNVEADKRALKAGETLDGEGGYTVWGKLVPAERSLAEGALPIGLAHKVPLKRDIAAGAVVRWADVDVPDSAALRARRDMERRFASPSAAIAAQ
jgi:predicted homoserine dehydrogenase-like protein